MERDYPLWTVFIVWMAGAGFVMLFAPPIQVALGIANTVLAECSVTTVDGPDKHVQLLPCVVDEVTAYQVTVR